MSVTASYQIQGLKLLDGKVAVIYGAAGGVGAAVAKAFAREGATVFLAGRTENSLNLIAKEISNSGGVADVSKVDALSPESVEAHLHRVCHQSRKARRFLQPHWDKCRNRLEADRAFRPAIRGRCLQQSQIIFHHHDRRSPHNGEARQRCHPRAHGTQRSTPKTEHGRILSPRSGYRGSLQTTSLRSRTPRSPGCLPENGWHPGQSGSRSSLHPPRQAKRNYIPSNCRLGSPEHSTKAGPSTSGSG